MKKELEKFMSNIENNQFNSLDYIRLKVTDACNLRCVGCDFWKKTDFDQLEESIIYSILKQSKNLGAKSLHISGGEPTLRKDLVNIIKFANSLNYSVRMVTNGTQLNEKLIQSYVKAGLNSVTFSLDSPRSRENILLRGKESNWNKITSNISSAVKYKPKLQVGINTVVSAKNINQLGDMIILANKLGVSWLRFTPFCKAQQFLHTGKKNDSPIFTKDQLEKFNKYTIPLLEELIANTNQIVYPEHLHLFGYTNSDLNNSVIGEYSKNFYAENICFSPFNHITVYPNGDVMPCCKIPLTAGIIGNVYKDSIKSIVENSKSELVRVLRLNISITNLSTIGWRNCSTKSSANAGAFLFGLCINPQ